MAGKLREIYGSVADPAVVPGGVDAEQYRPDAGEYEPMSDDEIAFLTVRRLSPRMGHGILLEAFARVGADHPNAHLYVAGDGPLREELEDETDALGVAERVTFLGYVPDDELPSAYAAADCFVLPTTKLEGFGLATLEALASGTPVVATPVGGTTEILSGLDVDDRVPSAMLVPSVDAAALADRMSAWADLSVEERESAGRVCRKYARENYAWERTVDELEARYAGLLGESAAGDSGRRPKPVRE